MSHNHFQQVKYPILFVIAAFEFSFTVVVLFLVKKLFLSMFLNKKRPTWKLNKICLCLQSDGRTTMHFTYSWCHFILHKFFQQFYGQASYDLPFMYIFEEPIVAKQLKFIPTDVTGDMIGNRFGIFGCNSNKSTIEVKGTFQLSIYCIAEDFKES